MSRRKHEDKSKGQLARQRLYIHLVALGLAAGVFFLVHGKPTGAQSTAPPVAKESVKPPEARTEFEGLQGRWLRPDGGYIVEIHKIDAQGKMAAAYFNPRPINVSRAAASREGNAIKVFIELRDLNYPGATYNLTYEAEKDQLRGVYFQPALQQSFDVFFVRMK